MNISVMRVENKIHADAVELKECSLVIPIDINYISYRDGVCMVENADGTQSTEYNPFLDEVQAYVNYVPTKYYDAERKEYKTTYENQDVPEWGLLECPPLPEPTYVELRLAEYPTAGEQFDMQYHDMENGTTVWKDTIAAIKAKYPKP